MIPVLTPAEMAAVDVAAPEPVEVLIDRAGRAVARAAARLLGGSYGRRVVVVAGPGNNGADGRVAARHLRRRGMRVAVVAPDVATLPDADLVVDAAFGTGLSRPYSFPTGADGALVLAVDIPSGVDGLCGVRLGSPRRADATVTFAALKPGLLVEPGRSLAGRVEVADIGLDVGSPSAWLVTEADVARWLPSRPPDDHKWQRALRVVGGSDGMSGAPQLTALGALRAGAGYVQLAVPGAATVAGPIEAVAHAVPATDWGSAAAAGTERLGAIVVGPGLGRGHDTEVAAVLGTSVPTVLDADGLTVGVVDGLPGRSGPTVLTPHDGEFARIHGGTDDDRVESTRALAARTGAVVLRKGPTTVIADPAGEVRFVASGGPTLATAGTGDVLAGVIGAFLARGVAPLDAASAAAWVHATAAGERVGLVASDLPVLVASVLARLAS